MLKYYYIQCGSVKTACRNTSQTDVRWMNKWKWERETNHRQTVILLLTSVYYSIVVFKLSFRQHTFHQTTDPQKNLQIKSTGLRSVENKMFLMSDRTERELFRHFHLALLSVPSWSVVDHPLHFICICFSFRWHVMIRGELFACLFVESRPIHPSLAQQKRGENLPCNVYSSSHILYHTQIFTVLFTV